MRNTTLILMLLMLAATGTAQAAGSGLPVKNTVTDGVREWMERESVFGGQVYLRTAGNPDHPPVVLIHGLGDEASTSWDASIEALKNDYFILTLDLPGFGRSSRLNALYSPANYARLIHRLTEKILNRPFHLVGHSMGGAITLQFTHSYPAKVKTLTLIDAAGILHRLAYTKYLAPLGIDKVLNQYNLFGERKIADLAGVLMSALEKRTPVNMDLLINLEPFRAKVLRGNPTMIAGLALVLNDFSRMPETIQQPTLIIWGESDKIAPVRTGLVLEALIPNARLELIPGGGHMAFIERPELFNNMLTLHLQQHRQPRKRQTAKTPQTGYRDQVTCRNSDGQVITGKIGSLLVDHCRNTLILDADIDNLVVIESSVTIRNTQIKSATAALTVHDSSLNITTGRIEGETAIVAHNSRLDIAGTQLTGRQAAVTAPTDSTVIFSLGRIDSPIYRDRVIHGMKVVAPGSYL
ncbi:MAG: alpha/beta hydrolase [Candidatus Thiodiazotropha sp. (ex Epidulcina cf. delphinae)]|nr:alpha/beta hydrolase [Candidatus Thiodiazotropha sp. (ex Epidulcina cf. delphinae)]